ncbi:hypothetical protein SUDANB145_01994 [Streptomyces sp. enrichment culture]|uniref:DUF4190 domain-containing protein n=1 Tax=Streptomyces sp. enrichment culture TaxID=1795815 RepID=UPI003F57479D
MSDDAQTPEADAHGPTAPPGAGRRDTAGAVAGAGQAPADRPGGGKVWPPPVNDSPDASGGSGPPAPVPGDPTPWPAPSAPESDHQTVTSIPTLGDQPAEAVPAPPPQPWATPSGTGAAPAASSPSPDAANPFAAPTSTPPHGQTRPPFVPPPPIAPDGPGQAPYGYPGAHGYPGPGPGYGGGPQPQGYYGWQGLGPMPPRNGMGTAGLVLGIIAAVGFCMWPIAILLGVLGVIFGVVGRAKARKGEATNSGQALAGIICGAFGIALGVGFAVLIFTSA